MPKETSKKLSKTVKKVQSECLNRKSKLASIKLYERFEAFVVSKIQQEVQTEMMTCRENKNHGDTDTSRLLVCWHANFTCPRSLAYDKTSWFFCDVLIAQRKAVRPKEAFRDLARKHFELNNVYLRDYWHNSRDIPMEKMTGEAIEYYGGTPTDPKVVECAYEYYAFLEFTFRYLGTETNMLSDIKYEDKNMPQINIMQLSDGPKLDAINQLFDVDYGKIFWNHQRFYKRENFVQCWAPQF